jgi:2-polyprenyl-3-methyl-5-hydroxy-6-metoxy-1,4-benzoquinol methylase
MARASTFWNLMASHYAKQPISDEADYQLKLALTQEHLRGDMRLLEFGCGTGSTALAHAPHVDHIDAIDYSTKMIEIAKGKASLAGIQNIDFHVQTIERWSTDQAKYDAILGLSILHLLQDRAAVLAKVRKLLKPGGLFFSSTVCLGEGKGIAKWLLPIGSAVRLLPHLSIFTAATLASDIAHAGFEIEHQWHPAPNKAVFIVARAI